MGHAVQVRASWHTQRRQLRHITSAMHKRSHTIIDNEARATIFHQASVLFLIDLLIDVFLSLVLQSLA